MEDLILKLIDIEDRAQEVIKDAREADKQLEQNIADETDRLHTDIEHQAVIKSEALKKLELDNADEKCEAIKSKLQKQLDTLSAKYAENKDVWINNILQNIIGS